jgi:hypothetical protein
MVLTESHAPARRQLNERLASLSRLLRSPGWYVILTAILIFEAIVLHSAAREAVAPFYPTYLDQVQYLTESYTGYDILSSHGLVAGLWGVLQEPRAQGMLTQFEAAILFLWTGPQRLTALDLNIASMLIYLGVTTELVRRAWGVGPALATAGLIAAARTSTMRAGGVFDFRLDFAAMCLWGILVGLVVLGPMQFRRERTFTLAVTLVATGLVLTRIIAATYVAALLGGLVLLICIVRSNSGTVRFRYSARRGLSIAMTVSVAAGIWFIVQNWTLVKGYYLIGHVLNDEKHVRAAEVGTTNLLSSVAFYPISLLRDHAGLPFLGRAGVLLAAALAAPVGTWRNLPRAARAHVGVLRWIVCALLFAFLAPYVALTLDEAKSPVVGGVLLPPSVLAVAFILGSSSKGLCGPLPSVRKARLFALCGLVLLVGLRSQWGDIRRTVYDAEWQSDLATASQFMDDVGDYVRDTDGGHAVWAMDAHFDFTPSLVTRVYYFEQHGIWLDVPSVLGDGPIDTTLSEDEIMWQAASSSVLILTSGGAPLTYPYDLSVERAKPALFELAEQRFTLLGHYRIDRRDVFAYVRRAVSSIPAGI